jgi:hypothetical protein
MPTYRITILEKDKEKRNEIKEKLDANIKQQMAQSKKIEENPATRTISKAYEKMIGVPLTLTISSKWVTDSMMIFEIFTTARFYPEDYDRFIKPLSDWGKMKIERIDAKKRRVEKVLVDGK